MVHGLETMKRLNRKEDMKRGAGKAGTARPHERNTPWTRSELRDLRGTPEYPVYLQFAAAAKSRSQDRNRT
jgi:hypothetical protein